MGKVIGIPFSLGRGDHFDPKLAPLGVLAVAKNLRVRKDGRLSSRTGYSAQSMTTSHGTLVAYDLHEYQDRLLALGSDSGDPQPDDVYELQTAPAAFPWRASAAGSAQALTPFTNCREVGNISQLGDGATFVSSACGGGFVCSIWGTISGADCYAMIVRQSNGQVVAHQRLQGGTTASAQVCFSVDTFYVQIALSTGNANILQCNPSTAAAFTTFAASVGSASTANAHDLVPVGNPSTGRVISCFGIVGSTTIKVFNAAGAQVGSTATVAISPICVSVEGDQTDGTLNLFAVVSPSTATLRTFNFATGALTLGPVTTQAGALGAICRLPAVGATAQAIMVAVQDATTTPAGADIVGQPYLQSSLATTAGSWRIQRMGLRSRLVNAQSGSAKVRTVAFAGIVAPIFPQLSSPISTDTQAANVLVYANSSTAIVATRDFGLAIDQLGIAPGVTPNLSADSSTGITRLCWSTCCSSRLGLGGAQQRQPTATLVDFLSPARRQSARFGGLQYFAGNPVQVYDGRFPSELLFPEQPGIYSVTQGTAGTLIPGATYTYAGHWEYTLADGSLEQGPITEIATVTMGAGNSKNTILVSAPHSVRVALGQSLYGGSLLFVLHRTFWDVLTGTQASALLRCVVVQVPAGMAAYGAPISIVDSVSDGTLAVQGVIYTQGGRGDESGPLEHNACEGCSYLAATESRMIDAGLVRPFEFQESKNAFLGEPFEYSVLPQFYGLSPEAIVGVATIQGSRVIFTNNMILVLPSGGPDDVGSGAVPNPVRFGTPSGLKSWTSFLLAPDGLYFQLDDNKLEQMPNGPYAPGAPAWIGVDVQDTLTSFPLIIGTALCRFDDTAVFAATAATDARIVVRSLRAGLWTEDTPPLTASRGIEALCQISPTVAYVSGGVVFVQSATSFSDNGAVIVTQWKTNPIYPFEIGGNGTADGFLLVGELRSAGSLALRVSYDDGATFVAYDSFALSGASGSTVKKKWDIQQADVTSLVFEVTFTPSAPGEGLIVQRGALLVNAAPGELEDLDAADCA